jgi:hypothetical protein
MASIPQSSLFHWEQIEQTDDLQRLRYVIEALPDEALMRKLESRRGRGRDDYPVRPMWNSLIAGIVFQHVSVESLRRELQRNAALRQLCGFDPFGGVACVPTPWAYTRFLRALMNHQEEVQTMFDALVKKLMQLLPDLGVHLAGDGKAIASHARPRKVVDKDAPTPTPGALAPDGRRDLDANMGFKIYRGEDENGTPWEKVTKWFGYKMHLVADVKYELPVAFTLTRASASEVVEMRDTLLPRLKQTHGELLQRCQAAMFDKGYDDTTLITQLHEEHDIAPIIDIRNCWQDGKTTRVIPGAPNHPHVHYDHEGHVTARAWMAAVIPCPTAATRKIGKRTSTVARRVTTARRALHCRNAPSVRAAARCACP